MRKLLVKIPTKWRGLNWLNDWLAKSTHCDFLVSLDSDEYSTGNVPHLNRVFFEIGESQNKIHAINRDLEKYINKYDLVAVFGDDFTPVQGFDDKIVNAFEFISSETFDGGTDFCLHFNDGYTLNRLCTYPILGKEYYNRFKYVYHPAYKSVYADNEQTEVGQMLKRIFYSAEVVARHDHYINNRKMSKDQLYERNEAMEKGDKETYMQRKKMNFELW